MRLSSISSRLQRHIVGVGLEKCGTTTAHNILATSPIISTPNPKETFFFSRDYSKGIDAYKQLYTVDEGMKYLLDITPSYHNNPVCYKRIVDFSDRPIVLLFLRDPIHRAFSFYRHDILLHYSQGDRTEGAEKSIFDMPFNKGFIEFASSFNYYFVDFAKLIGNVRDHFEPENTVLVYFDELKSGGFVRRIENIAGESLGVRFDNVWSNQQRLPLYEIRNEDNTDYLVLKRAGFREKKWKVAELGEKKVIRVLEASQRWTQFLRISDYRIIKKRLYEAVDFPSLGLDKDRIFEEKDLFLA